VLTELLSDSVLTELSSDSFAGSDLLVFMKNQVLKF